ncbi:DUF1499 domain-containing protein [Synechococcus sp. RSCCF101]|uniref:DUF1499 domain-containing protein n=1 Tax=Synechococcus sp. RSCCF101 TaxID=2511069 RepID=UPI001245AD6C|nr:DUF1499 domain-containing protein [Synechococcus sp. RSCCF101]QEY31773.1 DUF1499 domain-containing protein [Synechococcus sp. RSCCF101]
MPLPPGRIASAGASLLHISGPEPETLGPVRGELRPCPGPAHCATRRWPVADPEAGVRQLAAVAAGLPGTIVREQQDGYVHATSESRLFGFVDDLELLARPAEGVIDARSESRLGDSDLGVNARRLEALAAALPLQPAPEG